MNLKQNHYSRQSAGTAADAGHVCGYDPTAFAAQQNSYHDPAEHWMEHDADVFGAVGCRSKFFR